MLRVANPFGTAAERVVWVDAFVNELRRIGVRGDAHFIEDMGEQLFDSSWHLCPEIVAQSQWDEWPPSTQTPL